MTKNTGARDASMVMVSVMFRQAPKPGCYSNHLPLLTPAESRPNTCPPGMGDSEGCADQERDRHAKKRVCPASRRHRLYCKPSGRKAEISERRGKAVEGRRHDAE